LKSSLDFRNLEEKRTFSQAIIIVQGKNGVGEQS
jgi:hypothetical protein